MSIMRSVIRNRLPASGKGVIEFGSGHKSIVYESSLKDQASIIADGWTIFTNTLIDSRGVSLTAATDGGLRHTSLLDSATKNILLTQGGQISITVPTFYLASDTNDTAANNSTGFLRPDTERFVGWDSLGVSSEFGGITAASNKTVSFKVTDTDLTWAMYLNSDDKPELSVLTLSYTAFGTIEIFVNGKFIRTMINQGGDALAMPVGLFNNFTIGNRFGNSNWMTGGFVSNLVISIQRARHNQTLPNGVTFFGHSFVVTGVEETNILFDDMDALINYHFERQFTLAGYRVTVGKQALGGGYVSDIGPTKLSSITAAAAATNPDIFVCIMGANDTLNVGGVPDANFQSELDLRIDELMVSTTNPDMILCTINTLKFDAPQDTPAHVQEVFNKNEIIKGAVARWDGRRTATQGRVYVVDAYAYLGGENPPPSTYIGQTVSFANSNLHPAGNGNRLLGEITGLKALQLA